MLKINAKVGEEKQLTLRDYRMLIFKMFFIGTIPFAYANSISWNFVRVLFEDTGITPDNYLTPSIILLIILIDLYAIFGLRLILQPFRKFIVLLNKGIRETELEKQTIKRIERAPDYVMTTVIPAILTVFIPLKNVMGDHPDLSTGAMIMIFYMFSNYVLFYIMNYLVATSYFKYFHYYEELKRGSAKARLIFTLIIGITFLSFTIAVIFIPIDNNDAFLGMVILFIVMLPMIIFLPVLVGISTINPVRDMLKNMDVSTKEDKELTIPLTSLDEFAELAFKLLKVANQNREALIKKKELSSQLASSAEDMSSTSEKISTSSENIASSQQQISKGASNQVNAIMSMQKQFNELNQGIQNINRALDEITIISSSIQQISN